MHLGCQPIVLTRGLSRTSKPVKATDIAELAGLASQVWERVQQRDLAASNPQSASDQEIARLKQQVSELAVAQPLIWNFGVTRP